MTEGSDSLTFGPGTFSNVVINGTNGADHAVISEPLASKPLTFNGHTGNDTIEVTSGGSVGFVSDAGAQSSNLAITVDSGGSASFTGDQNLATLIVNGTASLNGGPGKILDVSFLSVGGKLDLKNNKLITSIPVGSFSGGSYNGVTGMVQSGYNGGAWNGNGIISTSAVTHYTTLATASASNVLHISNVQTGIWYGKTVTGSDTLVMYTYGGDANLDGKLNVDDYIHIDSGIAIHTTGYFNGDFNYDGKINIDDYTIIDGNIGDQGPPF